MTTNELTKIWAKISGLFARKTEVATKADKAVVVTLSPDVNQQFAPDKTFDEVVALLQGGTQVVMEVDGAHYNVMGYSDTVILAGAVDGVPYAAVINWNKTNGITFEFKNLQETLTAGDGIVIDGTKISAEREIFWIDIKEQGSGYVYADGFDPASIKVALDAGKRLIVRRQRVGPAPQYESYCDYFGVFCYYGQCRAMMPIYNPPTNLAGWIVLLLDSTGISSYSVLYDSTPTANSGKPITSGGVFTALQGKADTTALQNFCPIIEDTRTAAVSEITGVAPFATLQDGQRVLLKLVLNSGPNSALNLTLSDGTTTGAIPVYVMTYIAANRRLAAADARAGGYIELIYNESGNRWQMVGYKDMNTTYNATNSTAIKQGTLTEGYLVSPAVLRECFYIKDEAQAKRRVVDNSQDASVVLSADTYNQLGTTDAPTVVLPASYTAADEFLYNFTCATDACVVTLPQGVVLADCCDDFSEVGAGVWFQVSIMDGVAAYLCVTPQN